MALDETWHADRVVLIAPPADMIAAADRFFRFMHLGTGLREPFYEWCEQRTGVHPRDMQAFRHLAALGQPALIVHDLGDREVPWEEGECYARHWPGARMLTTNGLGHNRIVDDAGVINAALRFARGETVGERVVSSPKVVRRFCGTCGTSLTWQHEDWPLTMDVTTASLDDANAFAPQREIWTGEKLAWQALDPALPHFPRSSTDSQPVTC
jgi:hypothetical protein